MLFCFAAQFGWMHAENRAGWDFKVWGSGFWVYALYLHVDEDVDDAGMREVCIQYTSILGK
jgi:hypothetical protein